LDERVGGKGGQWDRPDRPAWQNSGGGLLNILKKSFQLPNIKSLNKKKSVHEFVPVMGVQCD
jgi:hypothetical protein